MSSGGFERHDRARPAEPQQGREDGDSANTDAHELLDEVLQETLAPGGGSDPINAAELQALTDVVRQYGSEMAEEGALDLVRCLLKMRFARSSADRPRWDRVAEGVTRVLLDDAPSESRLRRFWQRLDEAVG